MRGWTFRLSPPGTWSTMPEVSSFPAGAVEGRARDSLVPDAPLDASPRNRRLSRDGGCPRRVRLSCMAGCSAAVPCCSFSTCSVSFSTAGVS